MEMINSGVRSKQITTRFSLPIPRDFKWRAMALDRSSNSRYVSV